MVDGKKVKVEDTIKLLVVSFDRKLTTKPHAKAMLLSTTQRAAVIARLVNHIPHGSYLRQLAMGLVNRKLCHALAAYASPRLPALSGEAENPSTVYHQIQVAYNRVARSITGVKLRDRVSVPDLLERADIPIINGMVVNAVAMKTWNCRHSSNGKNGAKNFVGSLIFDTGPRPPSLLFSSLAKLRDCVNRREERWKEGRNEEKKMSIEEEELSESQVLGTVQHGDGHQDAAGVLTSAGAPLWFIRGCSPSTTPLEDGTKRSRPRGRDQDRKRKEKKARKYNTE
jgi:hypothetical protein